MNWYAYTAAGPDHKSITPEQIADAAANMRTMRDQPHLKPELAPTVRKPSGIWLHYAALAGASSTMTRMRTTSRAGVDQSNSGGLPHMERHVNRQTHRVPGECA